MGTETQLVKVEHLYKEFDADTKVLSDINLTINKNEVIAILGPSGTGKSTLLRCLNYNWKCVRRRRTSYKERCTGTP